MNYNKTDNFRINQMKTERIFVSIHLGDQWVNEEASGKSFNHGTGQEERVIDMANSVLKLTGSEAGTCTGSGGTGTRRPTCCRVSPRDSGRSGTPAEDVL